MLALVLLSLVFLAWSDPRQLVLPLISLTFNWCVGAAIGRAREAGRSRAKTLWLNIGVWTDILVLVWFKYTPALAQGLGQGFHYHSSFSGLVLPLGISFFTFQEIAYLVDTARGQAEWRRPLDYAVFTTFFSKFIAGPIVRWNELGPQLRSGRVGRLLGGDVLVGLVMTFFGLFKKTVIADSLSPYTSALFDYDHVHSPGLAAAWLTTLTFSVQIYFDFSGYSDMALGLARIFGLKLPLNFYSPYRASCIIEYWRRWHMTLQRFTVVYIFEPIALPLTRASARMGLKGWRAFWLETYVPVFFAFLVLGIWHGAGWTFVIFGALHGTYVGVNWAWRELGKQRRRRARRAGGVFHEPESLERLGYRVLTLLAVLVANAMFRAATAGQGFTIWRGMAGLNGVAGAMPSEVDGWLGVVLACALALIFLFPNTQQILGRFDPAQNWAEWREVGRAPISWTWKPSIAGVLYAAAALFLGVMFIQNGHAVFLYFNF